VIFSLASVLSLKGSSETSGLAGTIAQTFSALSDRVSRCSQSVHFNAKGVGTEEWLRAAFGRQFQFSNESVNAAAFDKLRL
jgi:hypothetical protein